MLLSPGQKFNASSPTACLPHKRSSELCVVDPSAQLQFYQRSFDLPPGWDRSDGGVATFSAAGLPVRPPTLSVADFFSDGYPVILMPLLAPSPLKDPYPTECKGGRPCLSLLRNDDSLRCSNRSWLELGSADQGNVADPPPQMLPLLVDRDHD